jgi:hypothetical protein
MTMSKAGSLGGKKIQPVTGKSGIKSGGANVPNAKPVQGQGGYGYASPSKTSVPTGGKKK